MVETLEKRTENYKYFPLNTTSAFIHTISQSKKTQYSNIYPKHESVQSLMLRNSHTCSFLYVPCRV